MSTCQGLLYCSLENVILPDSQGSLPGLLYCEAPWLLPPPSAEGLIPWTLGHLSHWVVVTCYHLPCALLRVVNLWIRVRNFRGIRWRVGPAFVAMQRLLDLWPNVWAGEQTGGTEDDSGRPCLGWSRDDSGVKGKGQAGGQPYMMGISVKILPFLKRWGSLKCGDHLSTFSTADVEPSPVLSSIQ